MFIDLVECSAPTVRWRLFRGVTPRAARLRAPYAAADAGAILGAAITADVTSTRSPCALPVMFTNLNFCFVFFDMPAEKHASSSRMYSLNASPFHLPIF